VLANERLEALRRLAVQTWHHGYTLPVSALREAKSAGFDEAQIGAVVDMIGRSRPAVRRLAA
jgi:alkylhydroperoxidase family enzyme